MRRLIDSIPAIDVSRNYTLKLSPNPTCLRKLVPRVHAALCRAHGHVPSFVEMRTKPLAGTWQSSGCG